MATTAIKLWCAHLMGNEKLEGSVTASGFVCGDGSHPIQALFHGTGCD